MSALNKACLSAVLIAGIVVLAGCTEANSQQEGKVIALHEPEPPTRQAPRVGEAAPDFTLEYLGSDETVSLSDFKGQQPVVLIFGSYT